MNPGLLLSKYICLYIIYIPILLYFYVGITAVPRAHIETVPRRDDGEDDDVMQDEGNCFLRAADCISRLPIDFYLLCLRPFISAYLLLQVMSSNPVSLPLSLLATSKDGFEFSLHFCILKNAG